MSEEQQQKKSGCLKYALIGCGVMLVLGVLCVCLIVYQAKKLVTGMTSKYTDEAPRELVVPAMQQEEKDALMKRVNDFADAIKQDKPAPALALSANELNVLINGEKGLGAMGGKATVEIDGEKLNAQLSIPLEKLGFKGRYLNGSGVFTVGLGSGGLSISTDSMEVKGEKLPQQFTSAFGTGLQQQLADDPNVSALLKKIKSIEVRDGQVHIVPMNQQQ